MFNVVRAEAQVASLSPHALLFQDREIDGHLFHSLLHFHIFFLWLTITLLAIQSVVTTAWVMKSYCCGPQVLALLSDTEFPFFPSCCNCWMWLIFGLGSRSLSDLEQKGNYCFNARSLYKYHVFILVLFHCLSTSDLSFNSFLPCKICSKYFGSGGILLVNFFVSSSLFFSALTDCSGSAHYVFFPFLSPSPPVLSSSRWLLSALFSFDVFALLLF